MGADNWTTCPVCLKNAIFEHEKLQEQVQTGYGKIPRADYLALVEKADQEPQVETTLREDYELETIPEGDFELNYRCSCTKCRFSRKVTAMLDFDLKSLAQEIVLSE